MLALSFIAGAPREAEARHGRWIAGLALGLVGVAILSHHYRHRYYYPYYYPSDGYYYYPSYRYYGYHRYHRRDGAAHHRRRDSFE